MSDEKPDLSQSRPLTEKALRRLDQALPEGSSKEDVICVTRPNTGGELWYYDTVNDVWIEPCVC